MDRRQMLKTAVAAPFAFISANAPAAESPLAALGRQMQLLTLDGQAMPSEKSGMEALLDEYQIVKAQLVASHAKEDAYYDDTSRPDPAMIAMTDLPVRHQFLNRDRVFYSLRPLNDHFDKDEASAIFHGKLMGEAEGERRLKISRSERAAAIALYNARDEKYQAWSIRSGNADVEKQTEVLSDREAELDDAIINWACDCFADVQKKALHIDHVYKDQMSQETLTAVIRGFLPSASTAR